MKRTRSAFVHFALLAACCAGFIGASPAASPAASIAASIAGTAPAVKPAPAVMPAIPVTPGANASATQDGKVPIRYVRVASSSATARNLGDTRGKSVGTFAKGTPLAVYREAGRYLAVEAPGGFRAWVSGRFLRATSVNDVREVTGNGINIRPGPKADVQNFPLGTSLFAGDRVRILKKDDESLADDKAWFQILTPPGVTAWVAAAEVEDFPTGVNSVNEWKQAVLAAVPVVSNVTANVGTSKPIEAAATKIETLKQDARTVLEGAQKMLAREQGLATPDFGKVRAELERAKRLAGDGIVAVEAQAALERVDALSNVADLRGQLQAERQRVVEDTAKVQDEAWQRARRADPLSVLFLARGVLERRIELDGTPRYMLLSAGVPSFELTSVGGRYDLDLFLGCQVGVRGVQQNLLGMEVITVRSLEVVACR